MKVSIITVAFNSERTIEATIRSVLAQDHPELEYIVVDGGSQDGTLDVLAPYRDRIARLISEPDQGMYDGLNKGLQVATGELIGLLNSDDVYADSKVISEVVAALRSSGADALYADLVYVDRTDLSKVTRTWHSGDYRPGAFRAGWMPPHPTFFAKKSVYDRHGTFATDLKSAADYELMLRFIHKHGISLCYLPRVIVKMRSGGRSNASLASRLRANREDRQAWRMNGLVPGPFTLLRKPLSKVVQFLRLPW